MKHFVVCSSTLLILGCFGVWLFAINISCPPCSLQTMPAVSIPPPPETAIEVDLVEGAVPFFQTEVPMYYINLNRSSHRRNYMESTFQNCGKLIRVPAVDGNSESIEELIGGGGPAAFNKTFKSYLGLIRASKNELALTMSHFRAIKQAYDDEVPVALIFEDDVSPVLSPFWHLGIDEVVAELHNRDPQWHIGRLQHSIASGAHRMRALRAWRERPDTEFCRMKYGAYGMVAYLISRNGMEVLVTRFLDEEGKFDCTKKKSRASCVADHLIVNEVQRVFLKSPPMFVTRIMEDATGVRRGGKTKKLSDQWRVHMDFMLESVQWAVEGFEFRLMRKAAETFADTADNKDLLPVSVELPLYRWKNIVQ